jgi:alpha-L-fucosidase 2
VKRRYLSLGFLSISTYVTGSFLSSTGIQYMNTNRLWYTRPAEEWIEALPVGNGRLGAMVVGRYPEEEIQLNEETVWKGCYIDKSNPEALKVLPRVRELLFAGKSEEATRLADGTMHGVPRRIDSYQPLASLRLTFCRANGQPAMRHLPNYHRELNLQEGIARVTFGDGGGVPEVTQEVFASVAEDCLVVRLTTKAERGFDLRLRLEREENVSQNSAQPGRLCLQGQLGAEGVSFTCLASVSREGGAQEVRGNALFLSAARSVEIRIAGATSYLNPRDLTGDPLSRCERVLERAAEKSFEIICDEHLQQHRALFDRVSLELPTDETVEAMPTDERLERVKGGEADPGLMALYFQYGRYLLMGSSRPGTLPANLQGIWNEHLSAPWNSDFHANINLQMNYWPAEITNLSECHTPLFDWMDAIRFSGEKTAKDHYNARGWVLHHVSDPFATTTPCDGMCGIWPMGGVWLCQHLWEHYAFTGDRGFLTRQAWPLMKGAAEFMLDFLTEAPEGTPVAGSWVTNPSHSPENRFKTPEGGESVFTYGATMDIQLLQDLFTNCLQALEEIGGEDELRKAIAQARDRLPPQRISPRDGRLQEWVVDYEDAQPGHRHISHAFGLHPGHSITERQTPELVEGIRKAIASRLASGGGHTGWSRAWLINMHARLRDAKGVEEHLQDLLARCTLPNLFDTHPPFQIDGNFGGTAGIAEALLQSHEGYINLLPALPPSWNTGRVRGLRARGGVTVDIEWREGVLRGVTLLADRDGVAEVGYGTHTLTGGEASATGQGTVQVNLKAGIPICLHL